MVKDMVEQEKDVRSELSRLVLTQTDNLAHKLL